MANSSRRQGAVVENLSIPRETPADASQPKLLPPSSGAETRLQVPFLVSQVENAASLDFRRCASPGVLTPVKSLADRILMLIVLPSDLGPD